ncbi:hypothetical protein BP5796_13190 [Coleophoma crateriformis]|uniref:Uncharacterized protein n=1 Tax=Coleophoma crateriformis TaxID=565419 RepID=A0A3D8Q3H2_9HELO|nr:hypothetical protein BP5796_13190 [Coleophoma crateriformis]
MPHIILIGTLDTKLDEFLFIHQQLQELAGSSNSSNSSSSSATPLQTTIIDCGRTNTQHPAITITQHELLTRYGGPHTPDLGAQPRGETIKIMTACSTACVRALLQAGGVHGILSAGGSGGTSLVAAVMRDAAPLGLPKLLVSTVASGDTGPLVGETDIAMLYSVVDIAGTNRMLRSVLSNAAGAMLGMSTAYERRQLQQQRAGPQGPPTTHVGITMFGVTTPGVNRVVQQLTREHGAEVYVFHATGHGGKAMERMVRSGELDAVLDLTTTEIGDHLFGGNMSAGGERLAAALAAGIPNVISLGATDMVNFGARSTVPEAYRGRLLLEHNPVVTLMRTTKAECGAVGAFIAEQIRRHAKEPARVEVWLPRAGVSMLSTAGGAFADAEADATLFEALRRGLEGTGVRVVDDPRHINDEGFAVDIADRLMEIVAGTT